MAGVEISPAGYDSIDIGNDVAQWGFIEFQTAAGVKVLRIATSDNRVTLVKKDTKQVTYSVFLQGTDSEFSGKLPVTISKVVMRAMDYNDGVILGTSNSTDKTLTQTGDTVVFTISIGVI